MTIGKRVVRVTLTASKKGVVTVKLPQTARGKHTVKVTYSPNGKTAKIAEQASAKNVRLTRR